MKLTPRVIGFMVIGLVVVGSAGIAFQARRQKQVGSTSAVNLEPCATASSVYSCLQDKISQVAQEENPEAALALLVSDVSNDARFQTVCHSLTHQVGHIAWQQKKDVAQAFETAGTQGSACASGFYHGVIEAAVKDIPPDQIIAKIPTICAPFAVRPQSLDHYNCIHGLGHGLFALRLDDWRAALNDCAALTTQWEQESCASGVFMQNVVDEYEAVGHTADFKDDDPLYPCTATESKWWSPCYLNQSSHVLFASGDDFSAVFAACTKAPDSMKPICYQSAGRDVSGRLRTSNDSVIQMCNSAGAGAKDCIIGAVRDYVYYERGPNAARKLCALTSGDTKTACDATIASDLKSL